MLIYEKGAFFKAHTDTEKIPGMFGTMVICLDSAHEGGDVIVKHQGKTKVLESFDGAVLCRSPIYRTTATAWCLPTTWLLYIHNTNVRLRVWQRQKHGDWDTLSKDISKITGMELTNQASSIICSITCTLRRISRSKVEIFWWPRPCSLSEKRLALTFSLPFMKSMRLALLRLIIKATGEKGDATTKKKRKKTRVGTRLMRFSILTMRLPSLLIWAN